MRISGFFYTVLIATIFSCCQAHYSHSEAYDRGREVYITHCVSCHGMDGLGNDGSYPALANRNLHPQATQRSIHLILYGSALMKPIQLEEQEIIDVVNFIQNSWGLVEPLITNQHVHDARTSMDFHVRPPFFSYVSSRNNIPHQHKERQLPTIWLNIP